MKITEIEVCEYPENNIYVAYQPGIVNSIKKSDQNKLILCNPM